MDDRRDTRRSSYCVRSDKHQFGLQGVPREHGGRVCREVGIPRREKLCALGRKKFPDVEKAHAGTYRLVFFPRPPQALPNLSVRNSSVFTPIAGSGGDPGSRLRAVHAPFVFTPRDPIDASRLVC